MRQILQVLGGATTFAVVFATALLMDEAPRSAALLGASFGIVTFGVLGLYVSQGWFRRRRAIVLVAGLAGSIGLFVAVNSIIGGGSVFLPIVGLVTAAIYFGLMVLEARRGGGTSAA